jgi:hypothetical protein
MLLLGRRRLYLPLLLLLLLSPAILFHSIQTSGAFEKRSMHGSCPVIKGELQQTNNHTELRHAVPCCAVCATERDARRFSLPHHTAP